MVDGLRFLAIMPVILQHTSERLIKHGTVAFSTPIKEDQLAFLASRGTIGVFLFFAISGFMLSLPFARHHLDGAKAPSLKQYFTRRFTRIEPPYLVWMTVFAIVLLVQGAWAFGDLLPHWLASCFYLHNLIYNDYSVINPVAWSLEIEIQFYLIAPWLVGLFFSIKNAKHRQWVLLASIFGYITLQHALGWHHSPYKPTLLGQLQHFLVGIWLADCYLTRWTKAPSANGLWDVLAVPLALTMAYTWTEEYGKSIVFDSALMLFFTAAFRGNLFSKFLNNQWVAIIGGMCYTIYLTHLPMLEMQLRFTKNWVLTNHYLPNLLLQLALGLPLVLITSALFYLLLEKPFMKKTPPSFGGLLRVFRLSFLKNHNWSNPSMNNAKKLLTVSLLLVATVAFTQVETTNYQLPPLDTMVNMAIRKSATVRSQDVWIEIKEQELKLKKKAWTNLLVMGATTNIGTNNVLDFQQTVNSAEYIAVNRQSMVYNAGLTLRVSVGDVVTIRDKNNLARLEMERAKSDRLIIEEQIREEVIAQYDQLQTALRLIKLEAQNLEAQRLAFELAERYFREGNLSVDQYTDVLTKKIAAEKMLEQSKLEAQRYFRMLKEFVGLR